MSGFCSPTCRADAADATAHSGDLEASFSVAVSRMPAHVDDLRPRGLFEFVNVAVKHNQAADFAHWNAAESELLLSAK